MSIYVFDTETFYDSKAGYTLKKMTTEQYINDPRFHLFGFSVSRDGGKPHWVPEEKAASMLRQLKLHEHTVVAHNAKFDMAILNWKYGVRPKRIVDTLAMARGLFGNTESLSLAALVEKLGLGIKGDTVLHMDGVRHPSTVMAHKLAEYCNSDVDLTWKLYRALDPGFPAAEKVIIDLTVRMFTEPSFELDRTMILREIELTNARRETLLEKASCQLSDLRSDAKFAALLESLGVAPPKKLSAKKSEKAGEPVYTWAFAKSDPDFKTLLDHDNELVQWACEARLGLKSTIKESRAQRFLGVCDRMGKMPIALDYYGAGTGRYAATSSEKVNCFTGDHEVLTRDGWVRIDEWDRTPIAQWWPDGSITWEEAPGKVTLDAPSELISVNASVVRGVFTADHRMVVMGKHGYKDITVGEIASKSGVDNIPTNGVLRAAVGGMTPDMARLLVALSADGSQRDDGVVTFGFKKERKKIRLERLLAGLGIEFAKYHSDVSEVTTYRIAAHKRPEWLVKGIGKWVLSLSHESATAFLGELAYWDGFFNTKTNSPTFCTTLRSEAEWVSTLAHVHGMTAMVYEYEKPKSTTGFIYNVYFRTSKHTCIDTKKHITFVKPVDGKVYCPQVASSYVMVRYQDRIYVTGQCQNLPAIRGSKDPDAGLLRKSLAAPKGHVVVVSDASQIEARIVAWLAGQDDLVGAFAQGRDVYSEMATKIYGRHVDRKKNPDDYIPGFLGKCVTLGCIEEGSLVLTDKGLVPIEQVTTCMRVWDGVEWVSHDGPVFQGVKEVITYDSLTATPDHIVYLRDGGSCEFGVAAKENLEIARTGNGREAMWYGGDNFYQRRTAREIRVCTHEVRTVWGGEVDNQGEPSKGGNERLPEMQSAAPCTFMARGQDYGDETEMHEPEGQGVAQLRGAGHSVPVPVGNGRRLVGDGTLGRAQGHGAGSGGQQRALRSRQSEVGVAPTKLLQHSENNCSCQDGEVQTGVPQCTVRGQHAQEPDVPGVITSGDSSPVGTPVVQTKRRVWDLLNAGHRNRFTVSGRLVHNCSYSMSFFKFGQTVYGGMLGGPQILFDEDMAAQLRVDRKKFAAHVARRNEVAARVMESKPAVVETTKWLTHLACAQKIVNTYRDENPRVPEYWALCGVMIDAMHAGDEIEYGPLKTAKDRMILPNGMSILYKGLERGEDGYTYLRRKEGRVQRVKIYGGSLTENICQALAGAYVKEAMVRMYVEYGHRTILQVHDEVVVLSPENTADKTFEEVSKCMTTVPSWAAGLPLASEGDFASAYGFAK